MWTYKVACRFTYIFCSRPSAVCCLRCARPCQASANLQLGRADTVFGHAELGVHVAVCRSDYRADIFSYGVLVWELVTQERPQRGVLRDLQVNTMCH